MNGIDQLKDYTLVQCPHCGFAMLLVRSESASSGRKKVTYKCRHCDTESERLGVEAIANDHLSPHPNGAS